VSGAGAGLAGAGVTLGFAVANHQQAPSVAALITSIGIGVATSLFTAALPAKSVAGGGQVQVNPQEPEPGTNTAPDGTPLPPPSQPPAEQPPSQQKPEEFPSAEARAKVPSTWGAGDPNRKKTGVRWEDPENQGNGIRIDKGDPNHQHPSQQVDHVIVRYQGTVRGLDGEPINGSIMQDPVNAHIPLQQWLNWRSWYHP
jgi:hypothetical protein